MKIQLLRSATLVVHLAGECLLVDPMLGPKGSMPPFAFLRHHPRRNPTAPLPANAEEALAGVTLGLLTHFRRGHSDHLDAAGRAFLAKKRIPLYCADGDEHHLARKGFETTALPVGVRRPFLEGTICSVPAQHGHGWIGPLMGEGVGYLIEVTGEPSLYLSGDTVLTAEVRRVLVAERPAVCVVHAGGATLDVGGPILMTIDEVLEFVELTAGIVIATHLEALNHCPTTRAALRQRLNSAGLGGRVVIPADGEMVECNDIRPQ